MAHKAVISSSYRLQIGAMGLFILGWSLWFLYDGYVGYPKKRTIAREFAAFREQGKSDQWESYAKARGWPDGKSGDPGRDYSDTDILLQKVLGFGLLPFAVMYCGSFVGSFRKWVSSDADGVSTSWGQRVPFASVTSINKGRWKTKGIAVVYYHDPSKNRQRRMVLDNFKYGRDEMTAIFDDVESHLAPADQPVGDADSSPAQESSEETG